MSPTLEPPTLGQQSPQTRGNYNDPLFDPEPRDADEFIASARTVGGRKRSSAFLAAWSAVLMRARITEACDALNEAEQSQATNDPDYKPEHFDANEVRRVLMVVCEALQKVEADAEREHRPCSKIRRGKLAAFQLECYYRREPVPFKQDLPDEKDRKRLVGSLSRAWRRRWKKAHAVQCFTHLAFVSREKGVAGANGKTPPAYTDRLTDLVVAVATRAASMRGDHLRRYTKAADELLAEFKADPANLYAPDWKPGDTIDAADTEDEKPAKPKRAKDPREPARRAVRAAVREAKRIAAALNLSEDEEMEFRRELHAEFETEWTDKPTGGGSAGAHGVRFAPVTLNADTAFSDASARLSRRTNLSALEVNESRKTGEESQSPSFPMTEIPHDPDAQARALADAFGSVGVEEFKVVFLGTQPEGAQAQCVGSEDITAARLLSKSAAYVLRSERESISVSVRTKKGAQPDGTLSNGALIQVDDCSPAAVARLTPYALLVVATSPGNYQVFLALDPAIGEEGRKALRARLLDKLKEDPHETANGGSYNAVRLPGSLNTKEKYRRTLGEFPRVKLCYVARGRMVSAEELEVADLLAAPKVEAPRVVLDASTRFSSPRIPPGGFPDFNDYLSRKWKADDNRPDRSSAEMAWACAALRMGFSMDAVESELRRVTLKGRGRSDNYERKTVENAARFLAAQPDNRRGGREVMMI